ncbi:hypothetical protein EIP86_006972 [Pleurotus ostreatoroseus]|nr:hypothetical protein EIP86_006972 [Pleurotus ostreatoroseus]
MEASPEIPLAGWRSRAQPHASPSAFTPSRETLAFALVQSTMGFPWRLIVAFFAPNIAVDAVGAVLVLADADFAALAALAKACLDLPVPPIMGQWRVHHGVTCQPFDYLWIPDRDSSELKRITVYGYYRTPKSTNNNYVLEKPVGDITSLPDALVDILGLSYEANVPAGEQTELIAQIRKLLERPLRVSEKASLQERTPDI